MCHENEMGAAKEQHPYIICRLDKQRRWNSGGTVTRPLFKKDGRKLPSLQGSIQLH